MTAYYVCPQHSNNGDGTTNEDKTAPGGAWQSLQSAIGTVVAGDIVYCKGTQSITSAITFDNAASTGSLANGYVKFVGVNASWANDGTLFHLDATGQSIHCLTCDGDMDFVWIENFDFGPTAAGSYDGINAATATSAGWVLLNCAIHNCGRNGTNGGIYFNPTLIKCTVYSNGGDGVSPAAAVFCRFRDNTGSGATPNYCYGCVFDHNGDDGVESVSGKVFLYNCVFDHNADDNVLVSSLTSDPAYLIGCRLTQAGVNGIDGNNKGIHYGWCVFDGNTTANRVQMGCGLAIDPLGVASNSDDPAGQTENGYTDQDDPEDYNLRSDAEKRRTAITIGQG